MYLLMTKWRSSSRSSSSSYYSFTVIFTADMEKLQQEIRWLFLSACVIDILTKIQEDL